MSKGHFGRYGRRLRLEIDRQPIDYFTLRPGLVDSRQRSRAIVPYVLLMNQCAQVALGCFAPSQPLSVLYRLVSQSIETSISLRADELRDKCVLIKGDFSLRSNGQPRTEPTVLRAVISYFIGRGARVFIGDSPLEACLEDCGAHARNRIADELADLPATVISLERTGTKPCVTDRRVLYVARDVLEADLLINLATYRNDAICRPFGCIANLIGVLPGFQKKRVLLQADEPDSFAALAVDLLGAVPPTLSFLVVPAKDAKEKDVYVLGVSSDTVALDATFERRVSGLSQPSTIVRLAADAGLGIGWPELIGEVPLTPFPMDLCYLPEDSDCRLSRWPAVALSLIAPFIWARPHFASESCRADCSECLDCCPTGALYLSGSNLSVDVHPERCVGCWRCREVCPTNSISIVESTLTSRLLT